MWKRFRYVEVFPSEFSLDECRSIIDLHRDREGSHSLVSGYGGKLARDANLWWLYHDPATDWIFQRIRRIVVRYNKNYQFGVNPLALAAQLTQYRSGQAYDWHMDIGAGRSSLRKISVVVELSAARSRRGGGLEVFHGEESHNRLHLNVGDVACFPSFVIHRARLVTRGTRWSLVFWIMGDAHLR